MARGGRHQATSYQVVKISAWVSATDWSWLQSRHPHQASDVLRRLIGDYRRKMEGRERPHTAEDFAALDLERL
jgi:hypothetical protein